MLPITLSAVLVSCVERREFAYPDEDPVIARIDGRDLLRKEFETILPEDHAFALTAEEKRNYLEMWITTELLFREAGRQGLGQSAELQARLEQMKKDLIADRLVQQVLQERAIVAEEEVRAYYEAHEREYTLEFRVSHILVNTLEDAAFVKERLNHAQFYWVAKKYSIDKHTRKGGDMGYLSKGNMIPEFEPVVFNMEIDEVSDVIESEFGYHIITLTNVRPVAHKVRFEDFKDEIAGRLMMQKRAAVYDSLVAALRSGKEIEIIDRELADALAPLKQDTIPEEYEAFPLEGDSLPANLGTFSEDGDTLTEAEGSRIE
jgi:peptidyl-prolyl cis-trans isomerase C